MKSRDSEPWGWRKSYEGDEVAEKVGWVPLYGSGALNLERDRQSGDCRTHRRRAGRGREHQDSRR